MATVELKDIRKVYSGDVLAVNDANISIADKEFVVLVGPSGCGKTTTLRMIAGLEEITSGDLLIDGKRMNDIPPKDRDIAMVFQNYALYPHMNVYDNMAFGLKIRKFSKEEIDSRVKEAAKILDIEALLDRKPKALSGGQRQRVAVGRAIVRYPKVFLFDEPLSNLDAKLRVQMRAEISALHYRLQATMIYVTHDQVEAMTMSDKIVVMRDGIIQQTGPPLELYNHPVNHFVAGFIGSPPMNFMSFEIQKVGSKIAGNNGEHTIYLDDVKAYANYVGKRAIIGIRPEDLQIVAKQVEGKTFEASVEIIEPLGAEVHLYITVGSQQLIARVPPTREYSVGQKLYFSPNVSRMHLFDVETEQTVTD